jgi:hypothetical protein
VWAEKNEKLIEDDLKVYAGLVSGAFARKDDRGISSSFDDLLSETEEIQVLFN